MKQNFQFVKFGLIISAGLLICFLAGCVSTEKGDQVQGYPIDSDVQTTDQRMIAFPYPIVPSPAKSQLSQVAAYDASGFGAWTFGAPLPVEPRKDIMPSGYAAPAVKAKLLKFFTFTDIHITDKEAPNQLISLQQLDPKYSGENTSIYSPVMLYTTQVLDAAVQTVNALHRKSPFDFGISLGDTCNNTSYNELRWYIDVIDGKVITPSSGAHLGAGTIDYQKPFKAAGLDKSIPWYQALGNHDHFYIGSFPVDADPSLGLRKSYVAGTVRAVPDFLIPNLATFPVLFNMEDMKKTPQFYQGVLDGSTPLGNIIKAGKVGDPGFTSPPTVTADPDRRSLVRTEWIGEFFKTTSIPAGHGFNLVDPSRPKGFACYSFLPKSNLPLKVIVLDDTQSENDGSKDIHGHGYLDAARWAWLKAELAAGQAANQLMIVAAHVPIAVADIGSELEWWLGGRTASAKPGWWLDPAGPAQNAVTLKELVATLQNTPNLLMWVAGHRHLNTVKAFVSPDPARPEMGFWQVETSSLRDFPQQFRTFEIRLNSDYSISIVTVDVDPAVKEGTPAAKSRRYAIAAQQIIQNSLTANFPNIPKMGPLLLPSMDPTRKQDGTTDPTIKYTDLSKAANPVPYNGSYNATLYKQLSPAMQARLRAMFP